MFFVHCVICGGEKGKWLYNIICHNVESFECSNHSKYLSFFFREPQKIIPNELSISSYHNSGDFIFVCVFSNTAHHSLVEKVNSISRFALFLVLVVKSVEYLWMKLRLFFVFCLLFFVALNIWKTLDWNYWCVIDLSVRCELWRIQKKNIGFIWW